LFTRVADRFYDLVVRSDYGIINVAWGLKDQRDHRGHQADQPQEPRAARPRRGLQEGHEDDVKATHRRRGHRSAGPVGRLVFVGAGATARAASPLAAGPIDPRELDEMTRDVQRFAEAVKDFRSTARIDRQARVQRQDQGDQRQVRPADQHERSRGEGPSPRRHRDVRGVPAPLPNEQALDARGAVPPRRALLREVGRGIPRRRRGVQEGDRLAHPPTTPPPRSTTRRPSRFTSACSPSFPTTASSTALTTCSASAWVRCGQEAQARQALLALVCSNKFKPLDPPDLPKLSDNPADKNDDLVQGLHAGARSPSSSPSPWTRIGEFHFDNPAELRRAIAPSSAC